jgi:hypothetical protein
MKRSKAIEEIRKVLAMNGKDNGYGELEEALLHTMEVWGMLPPPKEIQCVTENLMYCYYKKVDEKKVDGRWVLDRDNSQLWDDE